MTVAFNDAHTYLRFVYQSCVRRCDIVLNKLFRATLCPDGLQERKRAQVAIAINLGIHAEVRLSEDFDLEEVTRAKQVRPWRLRWTSRGTGRTRALLGLDQARDAEGRGQDNRSKI